MDAMHVIAALRYDQILYVAACATEVLSPSVGL